MTFRRKPILALLFALGHPAVADTLLSADFESGTAAGTGSIVYNIGGTTTTASTVAVSSSPDPTLDNQALLFDRTDTGPLHAAFVLDQVADISGSNTLTLSFDIASRRTSGESKTIIVKGYDSNNQPVFGFVLGDTNAFGNAGSDRQRPGYEVAGPVRALLPGTSPPAAFWWGADTDTATFDVTKDAHFDLTIGNSSWTVSTTKQDGTTVFNSTAIPTYDGANHADIDYVLLTNATGTSFGNWWDNITITGAPAAGVLRSYEWTAGGDGVSLFQENNWTQLVTTAPMNHTSAVINPGTPVNAHLIVDSGTPGGVGATGILDLGSGSLTVNGGAVLFNLTASRVIRDGTLTITGGSVTTEGFVDNAATLSGGTLALDTGANPLDNSTVDFTSTSSATLHFLNETPATAQSEHLSKITVNGVPAAVGTNIVITADSASGSLVFADPDGDGMAYAWEITHFGNTSRNGTGDFDNDGLLDLGEFTAGTDPKAVDSDGDGLADGSETTTDPALADSDGDHAPDGLEINNGTAPDNPSETPDRPNIIYILCDDLGYGDLGVLYQNSVSPGNPPGPSVKKHLTPNLDSMAGAGMIMDRHYCPAPVCAPSRASLLLGVHQGHANVRDNQFDKALEDNHTLGSVLRNAGYYTALIGKYGLQGSGGNPAAWPAYPTKRGFDYFFGYVRHGDGHNHYPDHSFSYRGAKELYDQDQMIRDDLDKCYTTDLFTARAKKLIKDRNSTNPDQPFFIYLAYDTPHAALQLPTIAYPDPAGDAVNGGLQWIGTPGNMITTATGTIDSYIHPDYAGHGWNDVEERFATSVRRIDDCIGDILLLLANLGIDDNTLVIFSSDNGPHTEDYVTPSDGVAYKANMFDSFGQLDGVKRDTWEGGIREPSLAWWPGTIPAGTTTSLPSQFHDWMATFAKAAKAEPPARTDGVSLLPTLTTVGSQRDTQVYVEYSNGSKTPTYSEFEAAHRDRQRSQMQVVHVDGYKGVRYNIGSHTDLFEIYDINGVAGPADEKETTNLAGTSTFFNDLQQKMKDRVLQLRMVNSSASRPYDGEHVPPDATPPLLEPGLKWSAYEHIFPYLPDFDELTSAATGDSNNIDLSVLTRADDAGAVFTGFLLIPADDDYSFFLTIDSRAQLRIHDATVVDADYGHASGSTASGSIRLAAGYHPIRVAYARSSGPAASLIIEWSSSTISQGLVPNGSLFREGTLPPGPPTANADSASTSQGNSVDVDVLLNDLDDGTPSPLTITDPGSPRGGTAAVVSGEIRYTPDPTFLGTDTFSYTISDGQDTAMAEVSVDVIYQSGEPWLPLNESSGTAISLAGGGFAGSMSGFADPDAAHVTGVHGIALSFDGIDNQVSLTGFPALPTGGAPRTAICWVRVPAGQANENQTMFGYGLNSNGQRFTFRLNGSAGAPAVQELRLEVQGGNIVGTTNVADGTWHHVAAVIPDGATNVNQTLLYVDGNLETISAGTAQALNTAGGTTPLLGGSNHATGYNFLGDIDEFRFFPTALSQSEIQAHVNAANQLAAAWHTRYLGNAAIDWSADLDDEGIERLLEYALGGNPHIPNRSILPSLSLVSGRMHLSFPRRIAGTHDLIYTIQTSDNLVTWDPATTSLFDSDTGPSPDFETVILDVGDATETREFVRLQVELAP